ncbi:DEAD/DEAH box helicase, partial [Cobetia marina]
MTDATATPAFASLALAPELLTNLETLDYHTMTPIQAQSLPPMLEGRDVIAQGQTGSGKTAAFGLGLLSRLKVSRFRV